MHCPFCNADDTKVIDSRLVADGNQVRRRRECITCAERFTTFESAELLMPRLIKQGGEREPFNEDKLRSGMLKALEKRPVSIEQVDEAISRVCHKLRASGEREVPSKMVGELVMADQLLLTIGGCAANAAVDLARMQVRAAVVGRCGKDSFGKIVAETGERGTEVLRGVTCAIPGAR